MLKPFQISEKASRKFIMGAKNSSGKNKAIPLIGKGYGRLSPFLVTILCEDM